MSLTPSQIDSINSVAATCHANATIKGFHDNDNQKSIVDNVGVWCANLHGEVSELWEAARRDLLRFPCDKAAMMPDGEGGVRHMTCAEEEIADIIIRAFDSGRALDINIGEAVASKMAYNATREHKHGGKLA